MNYAPQLEKESNEIDLQLDVINAPHGRSLPQERQTTGWLTRYVAPFCYVNYSFLCGRCPRETLQNTNKTSSKLSIPCVPPPETFVSNWQNKTAWYYQKMLCIILPNNIYLLLLIIYTIWFYYIYFLFFETNTALSRNCKRRNANPIKIERKIKF